MAWEAPFPQSRMPASIELSIINLVVLSVCLSVCLTRMEVDSEGLVEGGAADGGGGSDGVETRGWTVGGGSESDQDGGGE